MYVIVCGDREWTSSEDRLLLFFALDLLKISLGQDKLVIIEGECQGVDISAREWAIAMQVEYLPFPADWSQGRRGGPQRNLKMLQEGKPDHVIAFHDTIALSKGTKNMVELAKKHGITTTIYTRQ